MEDYPRSLAEFEERFATEAACLEYLARLRWPDGFVCPQCGANRAWRTNRGLWSCQQCGVQTSVTAGTIFHRTRKPLRLWFRTMWHITTQKWGMLAFLAWGIRGRYSPMELNLPHLVASLLRRWLLGTYQGAVRPARLAYYLDEFTFRFNRRTSRQRGKLFYRLV
jgi:ribosomal protein L37AE/L43A